jgi:hypothetical protein
MINASTSPGRLGRPVSATSPRAGHRRIGSDWPLVLLHGGLLTIDLNFGPLLEPIAASRQVIAVQLQEAVGRHRRRSRRRVPGAKTRLSSRLCGI